MEVSGHVRSTGRNGTVGLPKRAIQAGLDEQSLLNPVSERSQPQLKDCDDSSVRRRSEMLVIPEKLPSEEGESAVRDEGMWFCNQR